jgi:polyferredoxin
MATIKSRKADQRIRTAVQILFFIVVAYTIAANQLAESGVQLPLAGASLHAVCPFGGVVSLYQYATTGTLVKKVHDSTMILGYLGILLAILAGPLICGWACPLGSIQEWVGKLGRRIFKKRYNAFVPARLDKVLRYARYLVLAWVLYETAVAGKLIFQDVDPYYALFNFWGPEVALGSLVILGLTLGLSLLVERPFCKYACPYGAFQGLFNLIRVFKIRRNESTCIACHACSRECPMNIDVEAKAVVRDHQCISCLKCTSEAACPVEDTVVLSAARLAPSPAEASK